MTPAEIRNLPINLDNTDNFQYAIACFLREIAAQLADLNHKLEPGNAVTVSIDELPSRGIVESYLRGAGMR